MNAIRFVCVATLWVVTAFCKQSLNETRCLLIEKSRDGEINCKMISNINNWFDDKMKCISSNIRLPMACHSSFLCITNHHQPTVYNNMKRRLPCSNCFPKNAGTIERMNCKADIDVEMDGSQNDFQYCPAFVETHKDHKSDNLICDNSFTCSVSKTSNKAGIDIHCKGKDRTVDSHGGPKYAVIVGGIVGVLLLICSIVGFVLLRKRNCNQSGKTHNNGSSKQDYLMEAPESQHLSASNAVYFDNRPDAKLNPKGIELCHIQEGGIQSQQERPGTYSHLRNTVDDSDVMYDHTVRHTVNDTCDGDYSVVHSRMTEDDYDVSGSCTQSLTNKTDPVYT